MDTGVFQPFCCMTNVALSGRAVTVADVIVQAQKYNWFLNLIMIL